MIQRREVKSPFTKEERIGVFMTIEESREGELNCRLENHEVK